MKKIYMAPELVVVEIEMESSLMGMSSGDSLPDTSWGGESEGGKEADANGRRGTWGDLWAEEE